jgi:PGF-pre-PGF domain-containing protein
VLRSGDDFSVYYSNDRTTSSHGAVRHPLSRSCRQLTLAFLLTPGIFFLLLVSPGAALDWTTETVDSTGDVGHYTSLVLDSYGNPRISYLDFTSYHLKYAAKTGGTWISDPVDVTHGTGEFSSLALDVSDRPLISYYDMNQGNLSFATKTGDTWTTGTVDSVGVGRYTSLALDSDGNPRIAYQDLLNMKLKYAEKSGDLWINETVDNSGNVGTYSSLALDSQGNPSISYYDAGHGFLKYAVKSGGLWSTTIIENSGNAGYYSSLALDAAGEPRISYYDGVGRDLKFASKTGAIWKEEIVDSVGTVGKYTSLSLDASGNPHISYYDETNGHLKYAVKTGLTWINETVDDRLNVGLYTSLALDAAGNPRISYRDGGNGDLKYAIGIPPLIPNFTAFPLTGTAPLNIQFSDTSTGGLPSCWNWSFGDGSWFNTSITAQRNPTHAYEIPGTYSVTMVVENFTVASSISKSGYITIIAPPETTATTLPPTLTPTPSPTPLPTSLVPTPSSTPTPELTPSLTPLPSLSPTPKFTPTPTLSLSPVEIPDSGDDPPYRPEVTPVIRNVGLAGCQTVNVGGDSAVSRVTVTGWNISDIIITSRKIATLPAQTIPLDRPVYQYLDLMPVHYTMITTALIEFDVPLSFLDEHHSSPDEIRLWILRNQTWFILPTRTLGNKNGRSRYKAESPEFLLFAIAMENETFVAQERDASPLPPEKNIITEDKSGKPDVPFPSLTNVLPVQADPGTGSSSMHVIFGIAGFCGFGIISIIIHRRWIRR